MTIRPRKLTFSGRISAVGVIVNPHVVDPKVVAERVLLLWQPGAVLSQFGESIFVRFARPETISAEFSPGQPVCVCGSYWSTIPLNKKELGNVEKDHPNSNGILVSQGGELVVSQVGSEIDPSSLLNLDAYNAAQVHPLGNPPQPRVAKVPVVVSSTREVFRHIIKPDPGLEEAIKELQQKKAREEEQQWRPANQPAQTRSTSTDQPGAFAKWWADFLRDLFGRTPSRPQDQKKGPETAPTQQPTPAKRKDLVVVASPSATGDSWLDKLSTAWRDRVARILLDTGLARKVERKQLDYVDETMKMFENGDLQNALRRAIPLARDAGPPRGWSFAIPSPRPNLTITSGISAGTGGSINVEDQYARMERLYREAAEKLEKEEKYEEAAFVWAELLQRTDEAIAMLERHERYSMAADIAKARGMSDSTVIRLLCLSKRWKEALQAARVKNEFAGAITLLEKSGHTEQAQELRQQWAESLKSGGNLEGAITLLWPHYAQRDLTRPYLLEMLRDTDGRAGWALGKLQAIDEAEFVAQFDRLSANILNANDSTARWDYIRSTMANYQATALPETKRRLGILTRLAMADLAEGNVSGPPVTSPIKYLVAESGDGILRADLPNEPVWKPKPKEQQQWQVPLSCCGLLNATDAVELPSGEVVVALGELGVRLYRPRSEAYRAFTLPVTHTVVGATTRHVIGLHPRGNTYELSRFNLANGQSNKWLAAEITSWSPDFDGSIWYVAIDSTLAAIDATSNELDALWTLPNCGGRIRWLRWQGTRLFALVGSPVNELWTIQLPDHKVLSREPFVMPRGQTLRSLGCIAVDKDIVPTVFTEPQDVPADHYRQCEMWIVGQQQRPVGTSPNCQSTLGLAATNGFRVWLCKQGAKVTAGFERNGIAATPEIALQGANSGNLRTLFGRTDTRATVVDDMGRVTVLDPNGSLIQRTIQLMV